MLKYDFADGLKSYSGHEGNRDRTKNKYIYEPAEKHKNSS